MILFTSCVILFFTFGRTFIAKFEWFGIPLFQEVGDAENYRGAPRVSKPKRKRIKREAIVGPAVNKNVAHESVGLKPAVLTPKEIPVVKNNPSFLQVIALLFRIFMRMIMSFE